MDREKIEELGTEALEYAKVAVKVIKKESLPFLGGSLSAFAVLQILKETGLLNRVSTEMEMLVILGVASGVFFFRRRREDLS